MQSKWNFSVVLVVFLLLAGCAQATTPVIEPTSTPQPATQPAEGPVQPVDVPPTSPDLGPDVPLEMPPIGKTDPGTAFAPLPGDELLERGNVFVDESEILILESYPPQFMLHLTGNLPTPCHELRAVVPEPDREDRIDIELYSLTDPGIACAQVLSPFDVHVPLGSYTTGSYAVLINGEQQVGEIVP